MDEMQFFYDFAYSNLQLATFNLQLLAARSV